MNPASPSISTLDAAQGLAGSISLDTSSDEARVKPVSSFAVIGPDARRRYGALIVAFAVFLGGFVMFEPAPYELFLVFLLAASFLVGMRLNRRVMPLMVLFTLFNFGGVIGIFQGMLYGPGLQYIAVSYFLALSAVYFANVVGNNSDLLKPVFRAYALAAMITAAAGVLGYFGLIPGAELFTRYDRARGIFEDPNVFGPFLIVPMLYLIYGLMSKKIDLITPIRLIALGIIVMGLFVAFSRAAWGLAVICGGGFYFLLLITEHSPKAKLKYIALGMIGLAAIVFMLLAALQLDFVAELFEQRAKAVQDYDGARFGRFARHLIGYEMALSRPLGLGPHNFNTIFPEDPHNVYLKSLMAYGWLGFFSWMTIIIWTLLAGFKLLFRPRPWQAHVQILYITFLGHVLIGNVIDIDHWRHFYLIIGLLWGCILLEAQYRENPIAEEKAGMPPPSLLDQWAVRN